MGKRIAIIVGVLTLVLVVTAGWAAWTFREAQQHLVSARDDLERAQTALTDYDAKGAQASVTAAKEQSAAAAQLTNRWVWRAAAAVPVVGDSADAARSLVLAGDAAITALSGITDSVAVLDLQALAKDGAVDLDAVAAAGQAAQVSQGPLSQAKQYLAESPRASTGAWVLPVIEDAHSELGTAVEELASTADVLQQAGDLLPSALGGERPQQYFVAVQAPNETRGTGGLLGTWAVVRADKGKITVVDSGANEDLPDLVKLPAMGPGYKYRYQDNPILVPNMNMSPNFPSAATLWLDSWQKKTGDRLDGAISLDVTAVGQLLSATGTTLTASDGSTLDGAAFADFALRGVYDKFPAFSQNAERRAYQDQLGAQATRALVGLGSPEALLRALVDLVGQRRVAVWLADPEAQASIEGTSLGHALQPAAPHTVEPVLINVGWSKLDTYIDRTFEYVVGRCPSTRGLVRSELTMSFKSDIPPGTVLPEYAVGTVPVGPSGPVNKLYLQTHLPPDTEVVDVLVDGKSSAWLSFKEAGRPAVGVDLSLPPREVKEVRLVLDEPASGAAGTVQVQPMARDALVSVRARGC